MVSDGTSTGTNLWPISARVRPIRILPTSSALETNFTFAARDSTNGRELWKTDGTPVGTVLVKDIAAGQFNSNLSLPVNVDGTIYFSAFDPLTGQEL